MDSKGHVVELDGGLWRERMPGCVLSSNCRRVQEAAGGYGVAHEAQDVERGEVNVEAMGGPECPVQRWLRIE